MRKVLVTGQDMFNGVCNRILRADIVYVDTETTGLRWHKQDRVIGASVLCDDDDTAYYMPFRHGDGFNLPESMLHTLATRALTPERTYCNQNLNFDLCMLHKEGMAVPYDIHDTMTAAHLCNENEDSLKLESLAVKYLNPEFAGDEDRLIDTLVSRFKTTRKKAKEHMWRLPASEVYEYACQDVFSARGLHHHYKGELARQRLTGIYEEIRQWQRSVCVMQIRGMRLDTDKLHKLARQSASNAQMLHAQICREAGQVVNPGSPLQMKRWLNVPSTAKQALAWVEDDIRVKLLLDWRFWSKLSSTYLDPYIENIGDTDILHFNLRMTGTVTGRFSSSDVNILAVPRGPVVRSLFIPRDGYSFGEIDYSQAELKMGAHYNKDARLRAAILEGADLYSNIAQAMGVPRQIAKVVMLSGQYGIGAETFARNFYTTLPKARAYLAALHSSVPGIKRLERGASEYAERHGFIRMHTGRIRHYNNPTAPTYTAANSLLQGGVMEMLRRASQKIERTFGDVVQLLCPYHDAILFEIERGREAEVIPEMQGIMQDQPWCDMPMLTDGKNGESWGTAKPLARTAKGIPTHVLAAMTDPSIRT